MGRAASIVIPGLRIKWTNGTARFGRADPPTDWEVRLCGGCSGLPWVGVVSAVLLMAYLVVDRRGRTVPGMTDRDRNDADRLMRVTKHGPNPGATSAGVDNPELIPG
jgi:hypothetical protein